RTAVKTYAFNSPVLTLADGSMTIVAPAECAANPAARRFLERVLLDEENPVTDLCYRDLRQSMRNGGGPACLRLRVWLTDEERAAVGADVFWSETLAAALEAWVKRHYRDRLDPADLADP